MGMFDSSLARSYWYWPTSPAVTVIIGPSAPGASGWSRRMTTALAILVSEAMGTDGSGPDCSAKPSAGIDTAPWPTTGQGRAGAVPGTVSRAARTETERGGANGRVIRRTATTPRRHQGDHQQADDRPPEPAVGVSTLGLPLLAGQAMIGTGGPVLGRARRFRGPGR